eukprot:CAMPEP_0202112178 /NCGR_PEP_ID=MMETSP0965-20130614/30953_1 /ASSEMBLY_ACC=CAM_ASM_000507 /TAXON_ID=4773 /ORGANISM="Schizochytrium aggregatum, Strain ATCC28209" /LENGTH=90 /DNA_ID=CAMNT_0048681719 /DNA_START=361 /DNA_END=633 /DNA_ORIENTATION=+
MADKLLGVAMADGLLAANLKNELLAASLTGRPLAATLTAWRAKSLSSGANWIQSSLQLCHLGRKGDRPQAACQKASAASMSCLLHLARRA